MKTFRLILVLLLTVVTSHAAPTPTPKPTPITEEQREKITQQRDALLDGLVTKLTDANKELSSEQNIHKSDLAIEGKLLDTTNTMASTIEAQKVQITALQKSVKFWKRIVAIEAGLAAWFLCLWLKLPELSPPWGLVATVLAGPIAFGLCMLL